MIRCPHCDTEGESVEDECCDGRTIERLLREKKLLHKSLKYARRFLNPVKHDCEYIDAAIAETEERE